MGSDPALIARVDELEMRVAHQERAIEDLNATITAQWTMIETLKRSMERMGDRVDDMANAPPDAQSEPPPPHY